MVGSPHRLGFGMPVGEGFDEAEQENEEDWVSFCCDYCGRSRRCSEPWYICAQCRSASYCSRAHQRAGLSAHRALCPRPALPSVAALLCRWPGAPPAAPSSRSDTAPARGAGDAGADAAEVVESQLGHTAALTLESSSSDIHCRIFGGVEAGHDLRPCLWASHALRAAVGDYLARVRALWSLLDSKQRKLLAGALSCCPTPALLRTACVCRSWRLASLERSAWRGARVAASGWRDDAEFRGVLRAMQRVAQVHGLESFPEDPPHKVVEEKAGQEGQVGEEGKHLARLERPASSTLPPTRPGGGAVTAPCSPQGWPCRTAEHGRFFRNVHSAGGFAGGGGGSLPSSPVAARVRGGGAGTDAAPTAPTQRMMPSPLLLCRHGDLLAETAVGDGNEGPTAKQHGHEFWLLQPEEARNHGDVGRRVVCRWLSRRPELLLDRSVLEVNAVAGLVGLFAARYAKTVTITAPTLPGSRLVRFNVTRLADKDQLYRLKWSGSTEHRALMVPGHNGPVPVYVYTLPVTRFGADTMARQWQWDSGTAMRGLRQHLVTPCFDVIVCAADTGGTDSAHTRGVAEGLGAKELLQFASDFLPHAGLLLVGASTSAANGLLRHARVGNYAFHKEFDETIEEPSGNCHGGIVRVLGLRRMTGSAPWPVCGV